MAMKQTSTESTDGLQPATAAPADHTLARLREIERALRRKPFQPHPLLKSGHAQTIGAQYWSRWQPPAHKPHSDEARTFEVAPGVQVLAHCRWQAERRAHPTLVVMHGLEGSSDSAPVRGTAYKAYHAGFNTLRLNLRTCGDTLHLTPTLYHSGLTGDLLAVVRELIARDRLTAIFLGGFSLSGNMTLKLAGDEGAQLPRELRAVFAVSPAVDLAACATEIERRSNWLYQQHFITNLRRRLRAAHKLYPDRYDPQGIRAVRTIREFDARYTAPAGGYADVDDYYARASALSRIAAIRRPALVIHAQDDPFVPYASFRDAAFTANPYIVLLTPPHGGHVGFIAATREAHTDRFWAEHRIVEFCRAVWERMKDEG
jgi:predicted alpha/beta-fold hydrolase